MFGETGHVCSKSTVAPSALFVILLPPNRLKTIVSDMIVQRVEIISSWPIVIDALLVTGYFCCANLNF